MKNRYYYDLHMHSCLSPCGDNDMTPNNITGMGALNGLNIMALTDHNTAKNCPAFFEAAKRNGIVPVGGMELTTAEDIHIVCLFPHLSGAMAFDEFVDAHRIKIPNRVDIFGEQLIMNGQDEIIGKDDFLLSNATDITVEQVPSFVKEYGGVCYPAHVDREANGIIATLGTFPENSGFAFAEFHDGEKIDLYNEKYPVLQSCGKVVSSDAHYLWDIKEKKEFFTLCDEPYSSALVRENLLKELGCL